MNLVKWGEGKQQTKIVLTCLERKQFLKCLIFEKILIQSEIWDSMKSLLPIFCRLKHVSRAFNVLIFPYES